MDCSTPGSSTISISRSLLKFVSVELVMLSNHLSFCLQSFPASGSFPVSWLFISGGQSIGTSASASVLPINIQGWFLLGLIGSPWSPRDSQESCPASQSFQTSQFFASGGQSIGVSASASVLPINIQDWFPLGLTGLISLLSKGLSRVFSNTTIQKHQFFGAQLSL